LLTHVCTQHFPNAKYFRDHPFPLYDDLAYLHDGILATGDNAVALHGHAKATSSQADVDDDDNSCAGTPSMEEDDKAEPPASSQSKLGKVHFPAPFAPKTSSDT
jgi:hypothetical protein